MSRKYNMYHYKNVIFKQQNIASNIMWSMPCTSDRKYLILSLCWKRYNKAFYTVYSLQIHQKNLIIVRLLSKTTSIYLLTQHYY